MNPKIVNEDTEFLCKVILNLNSVEECYSFLDDLCTVQEIHAMAQRLKVAYMLSNHEIYADIVKDTGASTATISRVIFRPLLPRNADQYPNFAAASCMRPTISTPKGQLLWQRPQAMHSEAWCASRL